MSSLFFVPQRPTGNNHDRESLQILSETSKTDVKHIVLTLCEGKGCPKPLTRNVCGGVSGGYIFRAAQLKTNIFSANQHRIALSRQEVSI